MRLGDGVSELNEEARLLADLISSPVGRDEEWDHK